MRRFEDVQQGIALLRGLSIAALCGAIGTLIGLNFGGWMRKVQR
jgi:hypothetical protein